MTSAGRTTFTTTHWVINWVHGNTTRNRSVAQPTITTGLAKHSVLVVSVRNGTNGSQAFFTHNAQFARAQLQLSITGIFTHNLSIATGRTNELSAFSGFKFNIVNNRTDRHIFQRHSISGFNICFCSTGEDRAAANTARFPPLE